MARLRTIARRTFLIGSAALLGGVAFGWYQYRKPFPNPIAGQGLGALTPFVLIDRDGVSVIAPRAEMGQGIHSTLAALVAEEMDLDWAQIRVVHGPAAEAYYNGALLHDAVPFAPTDQSWMARTARRATDIPARFLGMQVTGGSTSIPDGFEKMRLAGAVAREALVQSAARRLLIPASDLRTLSGAVIAPDGTRIPYTDLAIDAASSDLPAAPPLRAREDWRLLGTSLPRPDVPAKSTGSARFAIDVRLPGMRFASIRRPPAPGTTLDAFDASEAVALPGVLDVIPLDGGIAAVATNTWTAFQALQATNVSWTSPATPVTDALITADLIAALDAAPDVTAKDIGDVSGASFTAVYSVPHLAHATMEPMTAAALLENGRLQVWAGTQFPTMARSVAAATAGLEPEAVEVHTEFLGGGFGRRAEIDFIRQAVLLAMTLSPSPVLLTWSREEDMSHDMYRPAAMGRLTATLTEGVVSHFHLATAAASTVESIAGRLGFPALGPDATLVQGAGEQPYAFPNYRVTGHRATGRVPVGFWRSVGASQNGFFHDCAMDELAHLAGADPLLFRMRQMDDLRSISVMEAVAEMSGWGSTAPGRAKGVAFCLSFGVPVAEVIEVEETSRGLRMTGAWIAADVGIALDPRNIEAQLSGAMIYGLSAAISGEVTFADGAPIQLNFWDAEPLRFRQCPPISVRVLEGGGPIRGVGEPGTPPAAPALANAIFALTGKRHRDLPLNRSVAFA